MIPYPHELVVVRVTGWGSTDSEGADLGIGAPTTATSAAFLGWIQPRAATEVADYLGTGREIGEYAIYTPYRDIAPDDIIRKSGTVATELNGDYRVKRVVNAAGVGHHLEIDADRLVPDRRATP